MVVTLEDMLTLFDLQFHLCLDVGALMATESSSPIVNFDRNVNF
jgi:hypothetical protein